MKKRVTALLMLVAMLVSLVPFGALPATAESAVMAEIIDYSAWDVGTVSGNGYTVSSAAADFSVVYDSSINANVLQMKPAGDSGTQIMSIPLGDAAIDTKNGTFVIEIKAKLEGVGNRPLRGFPTLSDGTTDNIFGLSWMNSQCFSGTSEIGVMVTANNHKDGIWAFKSTSSVTGSEVDFTSSSTATNNIGSTKADDRFFAKLSDAAKNYYTYRWVINPDKKTFRFYYSIDGVSFIEPYGDLYMANPYTADLTDRFVTAGVFPTGTLPEEITTLKLREHDHTNDATAEQTKYSIASIKTYPYTAPVADGNMNKTLSFADLTTDDVKDYATGLSSSSATKTSFAITNGALEITTSGGSGNSADRPKPEIPLGDLSVDTQDGPFSLRVTAKLFNSNDTVIRNFPSLGDGGDYKDFGLGWCKNQFIEDGSNGIFLNANNRSDGMWTWKTYDNNDASVGNSANNVNLTKSADRYLLGLSEASESYYTYRWDVDPKSKTFRFYYQKDGETAWTEPWADFNMVNPYESTAESIVRFEEKGVFPTGELPGTLSHLRYLERCASGSYSQLYIKSIQMVQELAVVGASVEDGGSISEPQMYVCLNSAPSADSVNGEAVELYEGNTKLVYNQNYTVSVDSDNLAKLNIAVSGYNPDTTYTLKLLSGKLKTSGGITLNEDYELNFDIDGNVYHLQKDLFFDELKLVDENGKEILYGEENTGDKVFVRAEARSLSGSAQNLTLVLARYEGDFLREADVESVVVSTDNPYTFSEEITVAAASQADEYYKIFAYNTNNLSPYIKALKYYPGEEISILYNNQLCDTSTLVQPPVNVSGTDYLPIEFMAQKAGYSAKDNGDTVVLTKSDSTITLTGGEDTALINDETVELSDSPVDRDGRMFVTVEILESIFPIAEDVTPYEDGVALHSEYYSDDTSFFNLVTTFIGDAKTERGFSWQAVPEYDDMVIEYSKGETLANANRIEAEYELYPVVYEGISGTADKDELSYYENMLFYKAGLTDLEPGTTYSYRIGDTQKNEWSEVYTFTTEAENTGDFSIISVTDSQASTASDFSLYTSTLKKALEENPDAAFMVHGGDFVEHGMCDNQWNMFFNASKGINESLPIVPTVGNHETRVDGVKYFNLHFNNPQNGTGLVPEDYDYTQLNKNEINAVKELDNTVYSFDYGDVHFAVLNTGTDWANSDWKTNGLSILEFQKEWLINDMKKADEDGAKWKILIMHIGVYPARERASAYQLYSTIDECGIDMVMQGHDHITMRTKPMKNDEYYEANDYSVNSSANGTVYAIMGCSGIKRYSYGSTTIPVPTYAWMAKDAVATASDNPSYNVISFSDDAISVTAKDFAGNELDSYTIKK